MKRISCLLRHKAWHSQNVHFWILVSWYLGSGASDVPKIKSGHFYCVMLYVLCFIFFNSFCCLNTSMTHQLIYSIADSRTRIHCAKIILSDSFGKDRSCLVLSTVRSWQDKQKSHVNVKQNTDLLISSPLAGQVMVKNRNQSWQCSMST